MFVNIETERLSIRPINLKDADFVLDLVNSIGWLKFIGDRNISNKNDGEKYIQKILGNKKFYYHVIKLKDSQKAIGILTFLERENEKFPDFGFALLPEFEKKGYALEASKAYLNRINSLNQYEKIIAMTIPDNQQSINLLSNLGFEYDRDYNNGKEILSYYQL